MPVAIVVAGLAIAAGLYFGLRAQAPVLPPPVVVAPPVVAPVVPPRPVAGADVVLRQATEALSYQRATLNDRCFRPALVAKPELTMELLFNVTFDAEGRQLARGVVETPGTSTPALTRCIGDLLQPLQVPAPGGTIMVEVPLRFP
jgi:hypothetical protein